jgi:hypothetical protein
MMSRIALVLLLAVAISIAARPALADCLDPTWCYCQLVPGQCEVLVSAEITAIAGDQVTLLVLEDPFYDPDGLITNGLELTLTSPTPGWGGLEVGQRGLFRVHPPGTCAFGETHESYLAGAVIEANGTYPCSTYSLYVATNRAALIEVVLGGACYTDAWQMMGIEHYCEGESGCCSGGGGSASVGGMLPMLLLGLTLLRPGKRQK